jgi:hypothetical protein
MTVTSLSPINPASSSYPSITFRAISSPVTTWNKFVPTPGFDSCSSAGTAVLSGVQFRSRRNSGNTPHASASS